MEIQQLVEMLTNSGTSIIIIAFFMYRDIKFMTQLQSTLQVLVDTVTTLKETVEGAKESVKLT